MNDILPINDKIVKLDFKKNEAQGDTATSRKAVYDIFCEDEKLNFVFIELPKFNKSEEELKTHFDKWLYFLKHLDSFEGIPEILNEPIFIEAFKSAEVANFTEEEYRVYEHSLMVMRDNLNVINTAREEGKIEGKIEIATEMILDGEPIGKIMKYSKLTESEITDLKNKIV